jgi:hypothetical protein
VVQVVVQEHLVSLEHQGLQEQEEHQGLQG